MSFEEGSPTEERKSLLGGYDTGDKLRDLPVSGKSQKVPTFTVFAILVCALCTGINIYAFNSAGKPQIQRYYDLGKLKRPNQFVGLDRVKLPDHAPDPILIYPNLIAPVNRAEPSRAYSDDPVRLAEIGGLVPPDDKQFKVNSEASTIVEFRTIDFKMEQCGIAVTTPPASATNVTLGIGDNMVDIWRVTSDYPLNGKLLTWNTRPARVSKVGSVSMSHGMNYTYQFPCPTDTLHAFEFSASGDATYVDWSQNHKKPTPGVVLWQHASWLN